MGDRRQSGIASYSRAILDPLVGCEDEVLVFADYAPGTSPWKAASIERVEDNFKIIRCWRFGALAPFMIVRALWKHRVDVLHIEYDVYLYGGVIAAVLLPILISILKHTLGIQVTATLHGVVPQEAVTREMLRENGFVLPFSRIGKLGFRVIYQLFRMMCDRVIALEYELANILCKDYGFVKERTFSIPHVPQISEASINLANEGAKSETPILLYFGFASSYKGLDVLMDAYDVVRSFRPDIELHVVAGRHPRLAGGKRYEAFYDEIQEHGRRVGAHMYDYLDDDQLIHMIARSSAVILPYTKMYASSGPLTKAIAFKKPVLASRVIYFEGAHPAQIFDPNIASCAKVILGFFNTHQAELERAAEAIAVSRNREHIVDSMHRVRCGRDPMTIPVVSAEVTARSSSVDALNR